MIIYAPAHRYYDIYSDYPDHINNIEYEHMFQTRASAQAFCDTENAQITAKRRKALLNAAVQKAEQHNYNVEKHNFLYSGGYVKTLHVPVVVPTDADIEYTLSGDSSEGFWSVQELEIQP